MSNDPLTAYERQYNFCPTCAAKLERREIDARNLLACPRCEFVFWNDPKPAVAGLIHRDGKVLLIKRGVEPLKGAWVLPGGYIDVEQPPEQVAIREVKEETGLEYSIEGIVSVYRIDDDPRGIHIEAIYAGTATGTLKLESGFSAAEWFNPNQLPDWVGYKHREAIEHWSQHVDH